MKRKDCHSVTFIIGSHCLFVRTHVWLVDSTLDNDTHLPQIMDIDLSPCHLSLSLSLAHTLSIPLISVFLPLSLSFCVSVYFCLLLYFLSFRSFS